MTVRDAVEELRAPLVFLALSIVGLAAVSALTFGERVGRNEERVCFKGGCVEDHIA